VEYREIDEGWTSMCFHFEYQSIQVNLIVSLVFANKNGKSYMGVLRESIRAPLKLKLLWTDEWYNGVS
jgi:hypothetical protein